MRNVRTLTFLAKVVGLSFAVGAVTPVFLQSVDLNASNVLSGGLSGTIIGASCMLLELSLLSNRSVRWLRRIPIAAIIMVRAIAYSIIILCALILPTLLVSGEAVWLEPNFLSSFWLSITIAFGISTSVELLRLLGKEAAIAVFTGRYRRPRAEDRIVMFADLAGSTALAERLGDLRFHELLGDVAYDLDEPIETTGGEVHRYVGDAIIVTWSMDKSANFERCLACARAMIEALSKASDEYEARYGQAMRIRIALHCGPVAAGEMGGWKKEIALLGDTMNTVARIESAAREFGADIVVSDAIRVHLPDGWQSRLESLPDYVAHGKQDALKLWSLQAGDSLPIQTR